jgi:hypothetical protein
VEVSEAGTLVTSVAGAITLSGTGGSGPSGDNVGILVSSGAHVTSTGGGAVTYRFNPGTGGEGNPGLVIVGPDTLVASSGGPVILAGSGPVILAGIGGTGPETNAGLAVVTAGGTGAPGALTGGHGSPASEATALGPSGAPPPLTTAVSTGPDGTVALAAGGGGSVNPAQAGLAAGTPPTTAVPTGPGGSEVLPGELRSLPGVPDPGREDIPSGADLAGILLTGARPRVRLFRQKGQLISAVPISQPGEDETRPAANAPEEEVPWIQFPIGLNNPLERKHRKRRPDDPVPLPEEAFLEGDQDEPDQVFRPFLPPRPGARSPLSAGPGQGDQQPPITGDDRRMIAHPLAHSAGRVVLALILGVGSIGLIGLGVERRSRTG